MDGSQRCEHCQRYAAEVEQGGERVIQARDGSGITLCARCIYAFWNDDDSADDRLLCQYLMALLYAELDEAVDDPHVVRDLAAGLLRAAGSVERTANYQIAYRHGVEVERSRAKGEGTS